MTIFLLTPAAFAIKTLSVKSDKVLLDLEGESITEGTRLFAVGSNGKKKALLEVTKVKGNKAIASIMKGKVDMADSYTVGAAGPSSTASETSSTRMGKNHQKGAWGVLGGYNMNSMTVKAQDSSNVAMTGSSFSLYGFYQMPLEGSIGVRGLAGYENITAAGTTANSANCTNSTACNVNISYLGLGALVNYTFYQNKKFDLWVGGGLSFLFAMSKSSNILDTSKVSMNQTVLGSLGFDYKLSKENFIPVNLDYSWYPSTNTSSASQIVLRAGYGWDF
jgi:hypothetical protein